MELSNRRIGNATLERVEPWNPHLRAIRRSNHANPENLQQHSDRRTADRNLVGRAVTVAATAAPAADVQVRVEPGPRRRLPDARRAAGHRPGRRRLRDQRGRRATEGRELRTRRRSSGRAAERSRRPQLAAGDAAGRREPAEPRVRDLPRRAERQRHWLARHRGAAHPDDQPHPGSGRSRRRHDART